MSVQHEDRTEQSSSAEPTTEAAAGARDAAEQPHEEALEDLDADAGVEDPDDAVMDSLHSALRELREDADRVSELAVDDDHVTAAEDLAERAASLDQQISEAARDHEDRG